VEDGNKRDTNNRESDRAVDSPAWPGALENKSARINLCYSSRGYVFDAGILLARRVKAG
jgi:hypothetical protein